MTGTSPQSHLNSAQSVTPPLSLVSENSPSQRIAQLIGRKCLLKCNLNGYIVHVLLDTGAQVSLIDLPWKQKYLPQHELRTLSELIGSKGLELTAANGGQIPHEGWVELIFNLPDNDDPNLAIRVPFLVSRVSLVRPVLGFNVIQELILGQEDKTGVVTAVAQLLKEAMQIESEQAETIVNFVQTRESPRVAVKVGRQNVIVRPGCVAHIKCKIPADFSSSVALFEVSQLEQKL